MSLIARPKISAQYLPQLTLLSAVVVADAIKSCTNCPAQIKWPNDIVIEDKKVCGILAESSFSGLNLDYVIIGIGINVNQDFEELPPDCLTTSTSLKIEVGHRVSRSKLLKHLVMSWDQHYPQFAAQGHDYLRQSWLKNNVTVGRYVSLNKGDEIITGEAVDISAQGGIILKLDNGAIEEFLAGDVSLGKNFYGTK